jgi:hypothetical protein
MKARVTMTMDPGIHARAKQIARARRTTVSGLFASFINATHETPDGQSRVDKMLGSAELRKSYPGADPLYDALHAQLIDRQQ